MTILSNLKLMTVQAFSEGYRINNDGEITNPKGKVLKGYIWEKQPNLFYDTFNFRGTKVQVHHLIAFQKYGIEWLFGELLVRHKNDNSLDNSIDNIVLGTKYDNSMDMTPEKRKKSTEKANIALRLFSDDQIRIIRSSDKTYKQLSEEFNCSAVTIRFIKTKRTYKHVV